MTVRNAGKPKPKPVDLSEYAEEAIPFDEVIRVLGKAHAPEPPPKPAKRAKRK